MRPLLTVVLGSALASPGAVWAQAVPTPDVPAPPPETAPAELQQVAPPAKAEIKPALDGSTATTVAPVIVQGDDKSDDGKVGRKVGTVAGGVVGGVAGAAVAGPVGKFAGAFVGKRIAKGLFGDGKKDKPQIQAASVAPSADEAAAATSAKVPPPDAVAEADPPKP